MNPYRFVKNTNKIALQNLKNLQQQNERRRQINRKIRDRFRSGEKVTNDDQREQPRTENQQLKLKAETTNHE